MTQAYLFETTIKPRPLDSRAKAREKVKPSKKQLHVRLIKAFYAGEWNADAWAEANGLSILSVRPRVSEINKAHLLHRIGYGWSQEGNYQDKFTLYPFYREKMSELVRQWDLDKAAEYMVEVFIKK